MLLREVESPVAEVEGSKNDGEDDSGNNVNPLGPARGDEHLVGKTVDLRGNFLAR